LFFSVLFERLLEHFSHAYLFINVLIGIFSRHALTIHNYSAFCHVIKRVPANYSTNITIQLSALTFCDLDDLRKICRLSSAGQNWSLHISPVILYYLLISGYGVPAP